MTILPVRSYESIATIMMVTMRGEMSAAQSHGNHHDVFKLSFSEAHPPVR